MIVQPLTVVKCSFVRVCEAYNINWKAAACV